MKTTYLYLLLALLSVPAFSQTKMGSTTDPEKGTILDLNNSSPDYVGGLKLPNVDIPNLEQIPATFTDLGVIQETNNNLKGLMVYNTNTTTGVGVYTWDGEKWNSMTSGQTPCGSNGVANPMKIGNNTYLTHYYRTGVNGDLQCWMVENLKEGEYNSNPNVPGATGHADPNGYGGNGISNGAFGPFPAGERGYYYTTYQAQQACPAGWSLPSSAQFDKLFGSNASGTNSSGDGTPLIGDGTTATDDGRWWHGSEGINSAAFAGWYSEDLGWNAWNNATFWFTTTTGLTYQGKAGGSLGPRTDLIEWSSIRCVQR